MNKDDEEAISQLVRQAICLAKEGCDHPQWNKWASRWLDNSDRTAKQAEDWLDLIRAWDKDHPGRNKQLVYLATGAAYSLAQAIKNRDRAIEWKETDQCRRASDKYTIRRNYTLCMKTAHEHLSFAASDAREAIKLNQQTGE